MDCKVEPHKYKVSETYEKVSGEYAIEDFKKIVCKYCVDRYSCMTNSYKMRVTDKDNFVMMKTDAKVLKVTCNNFDKIDRKIVDKEKL